MTASDIAISAFISPIIGAANLTSKLLPSGFCSHAGQNDVDVVDYIDRWQKIANQSLPDYSVAHQQSQWNKPLQVLAADVVLAAAPNQISRESSCSSCTVIGCFLAGGSDVISGHTTG
jgi:hypothetical protein